MRNCLVSSLLSLLLLLEVIALDDRVRDNLLGVFSSYEKTSDEESPATCLSGDVQSQECIRLRAIAEEDAEKLAETAEKLAENGTGSEFFGTFRKLGISWKHIIRSYIRIIGLAGGKHGEGDVLVDTSEEGLKLLRNMAKDMDFSVTPYNIHGQTLDDLFRVFLRWAETNGAKKDMTHCKRKGGINGRHKKINVSMALRRLEMYTEWIKEVEHDLMGRPITDDSVRKARDIFGMQLAYDDCNRLVWWFDLSKTDIAGVRGLAPSETRRFFVWFAHMMMFDERAQNNGIVFVQSNLSRIGFFSFMTMLPLQVGIKLDEFMICVVPLSTKLVMFLNAPAWAHFAYRILSSFLNRDMKSRVWLVNKKVQQKILEGALGHVYVDLLHEPSSVEA